VLYTLGWEAKQDHVRAIDAGTGKPLWEMTYPAPRYGRLAVGDQNMYAGPSASPEFDEQTGYLYTLGTDGDLNCWDTNANGKKVWGFNLTEKFGVKQRPQATARKGTLRDYGYTSSPLVLGDRVLVEVGAPDGNLMAFSRRTGERAWVSENRDPAGHSGGPVPITVEGVPCVAVLTQRGLVVTRTDPGHEGKTVATYDWTTDFDCNIATPTVAGDSVVLTSAYNKSAICRVKVGLGGAEKVWEQRVFSKVCSPVVYHDRVYTTMTGLLCLDWQTGETKWDGGRFGEASSLAVTGDGRIIVWANGGDLALVESADRSPTAYRELASKHGLGETEAWPHAVVASGHLFCKDRAGNLSCFTLR
jgi:outer membrane protein assembly factor BamB